MNKTIIPITPEEKLKTDPTLGDGLGCHSGAEEMLAAAKAAGKSETLQQYAKDYPKGPHDQPQSMCLHLEHCGSVCGCAERPRFFRALHAACTA